MISLPAREDGDRRGVELLCLGMLLVAYAIVLAMYFVPTLGGPDGNAYHVTARMIQQHGRFHQVPADDLAFVGRMWVFNQEGLLYSKYPPIYPAVAGVVMRLFGDRAGLLVSPVCAWLAVLGTYVLVRARLAGWAAVFAAAMVATAPILATFVVDQVSHPASVAALTWGYALFFLGIRRSGARRTALLVGSGVLVGAAVGVRYTNALLVLPAMLWLGLRLENTRRPDLARWLAGLAVPGAFLAWYHWTVFGGPFTTGYSLTAESTAFALGDLVQSLRHYVPGFATHLVGPVFLLSCCGFAAVWYRDRRLGAFYALWLFPLALLYMSYYYQAETQPIAYMRFLLPLSLPCILLALWFAQRMLAGFEAATRRALIAAMILCQISWGLVLSLEELELRYGFNDMQYAKLEFIRDNVPAGSTVFAPFWLLDALDHDRAFLLRDRDLLDQERVRWRVERFLDNPNVQHERIAAWEERLADVDAPTYRRNIRATIDAPLAEGREVWMADDEEALRDFLQPWEDEYDVATVAVLPAEAPRHQLLPTWDLPPSRSWEPLVLARITAREP